MTTHQVESRLTAESLVSSVWIEILGLDRVEVSDSFFDLGGTSIQAEQIASRLNDAILIELTGTDILQAGCVAQVARLVRERAIGDLGTLIAE